MEKKKKNEQIERPVTEEEGPLYFADQGRTGEFRVTFFFLFLDLS